MNIEEGTANGYWRASKKPTDKCLHDNCPECNGTGKKKNGEDCIHSISCPCGKCSPLAK